MKVLLNRGSDAVAYVDKTQGKKFKPIGLIHHFARFKKCILPWEPDP